MVTAEQELRDEPKGVWQSRNNGNFWQCYFFVDLQMLVQWMSRPMFRQIFFKE